MNERMRARAAHEIDRVVLNARLHARSRDLRATMKDCVRIGKRANVALIETLRIETVVPTRDHFTLVVLARVTQQNLQLKTIELGLGQWVSSFILDRVLSRENRKDGRQLVSFAVDRHLAFFHRFQQRRLRFWWRTIDLISEQDVSKYWSSPQSECRVCDVEDVSAGDVLRHQVRRELNTT